MVRSSVSRLVTMALVTFVSYTGAAGRSTFADTFVPDAQSPRKGSVQLTLTDQNGSPRSEAIIQYQQTTHDFLFGVRRPPLKVQFPFAFSKGLPRMD
jgi:hypothetical protein